MIDSTPPKYEHNECNDNHNKNDNFEKPSKGVTNFDFCYNLQSTLRYITLIRVKHGFSSRLI